MKVYSTNLTFSEIRNLGCPISTLIMNGSILPNDSGKRLVLVGANADYNGTSFKTLLAFGGAKVLPDVFFHNPETSSPTFGVYVGKSGDRYLFKGHESHTSFEMDEDFFKLQMESHVEVERSDFHFGRGHVFIVTEEEGGQLDDIAWATITPDDMRDYKSAVTMGAYGYEYHGVEATAERLESVLHCLGEQSDFPEAEDFILLPKLFEYYDEEDYMACFRANGQWYLFNAC